MSLRRLISRPRHVIVALAIACGVAAVAAPAASADQIDSWCTRTQIGANDGFNTYWLAEGVGWVSWRVAPNLDVYDRCWHGGIRGTIAIYGAAAEQKGGTVRVGLQYSLSTSSRWTSRSLILRYGYRSNGWTVYSVYTDSNIGMTSDTRIDWVKVPSYLVFNGVAGAGRREECSVVSRRCAGHMGT
jgi:hypothetical protein